MSNTVQQTNPRTSARGDLDLTFDVDYPQQLSRWKTAFRLVLALPILALVAILFGPYRFEGLTASWGIDPWTVTVPNFSYAGGLLVLAPLLMIVIRRKYPRWWFDWNVGLLKLQSRVAAYLYLLRDEYPSTDEDQAVHLTVRYPDTPQELNRWLPLVKWLLAIPHYVVLLVLTVASMVAVVIAWFAVVITGRYPRSVQLQRGLPPLELPSDRLRIPAGDRQVPAVPARCLTRSRTLDPLSLRRRRNH